MPVSTPIPMSVNTRTGLVRFTSNFTDAEAVEICRGLRSEFAGKMADAFDAGRASRAQIAWLHKMAVDSSTPRESAPSVDADLSGVVALIDTAATKLKFPKITVAIDGPEPVTIVLSRAGERSQYPGQINVASEGGFGNNTFYGRINRAGVFSGGRNVSEAIRGALRALSADPVAFAREYGRRTGCCCFCNRKLTDARSTEHGYGATCAKSFGLPWGAVSARQTAAASDDAARALAERRRQLEGEALATAKRLAERGLIDAGGDARAAIAHLRDSAGCMTGDNARIFEHAAAWVERIEEGAREQELERLQEERGFASDPDYRNFVAAGLGYPARR